MGGCYGTIILPSRPCWHSLPPGSHAVVGLLQPCFSLFFLVFPSFVSAVRLFLPKVLAGFMSGYLLEQYCTAEDCADPRPLWGWIMAACIPFPVALYLFKHWINLIPPRGQTQPFEL